MNKTIEIYKSQNYNINLTLDETEENLKPEQIFEIKIMGVNNNKYNINNIFDSIHKNKNEYNLTKLPKIKIEDNKCKFSNTLFNHYIINIRKTKINSSQKKFDLFPNNSVKINNSYNPNKFNTKLIEHLSPKDFMCLAKLGEGSFGVVYLVEKINTKEKSAMKVLNKKK